MDKSKTVRITTKEDHRIVAISDVHGHHELLEELIDKVKLRDEDYLVIVGDFINKGPNSYETLKLVRKLGLRERTIVLKGNHEFFIHYHMENFDRFQRLYEIIERDGYETLIHSLCGDQCECLKKDLKAMYNYLGTTYKDEFNYIKYLPIIVTINDIRFVHGGYQEHFDVEINEVDFLKYDNYNESSKVNDITTVVGHWPICNLRYDRIDNKPFFNNEKNIVFIDGAVGVKKTGELNACIIDVKDDQRSYDLVQVNHFEDAVISEVNHLINRDQIYVNYPHFDFHVLEEGEVMTLCRHDHSGKEFRVFNSLLFKSGNNYRLRTNYVNNFLNLNIGDEVKVIRRFDDCILVKYKDEFGWVKANQVSKEEL